MTIEMNRAVEIAAIEAALTTLLSAIDEQHAKYRDRPARRSATGSLFRDPASMSPVENLIDDPIGQSCRLGIRHLGERLNELDGYDLMSEVADRVCKGNSDWAEIIEKRWDGIGGWVA